MGIGQRLASNCKYLLANDSENPLYLAHNTLILLRQGATDQAQTWLEKLERVEPKTLRTIELKARILKEKGRADQAVAALEALVTRRRRSARDDRQAAGGPGRRRGR